MAIPTPAQPIVLNEDGSISLLLYQGRTFRLNATHEGLADPTGFKARIGFTDKYGNATIVSGSTEDGRVTFVPAVLPATGTVIKVEIPDEATVVNARSGKFDLILEEPSGAEIPVCVGDWVLYRGVVS